MPKVNVVAKARVDQGTCSCGKAILKGDSYKWLKFRFGGRRVKCAGCEFRPSDKTQSEFLGKVYDLNDRVGELNDGMDLEDLQAEIESIADDFEEAGNECQEKKDNMPEGLQEGDVGQLLEQRSNDCSEIAGNLQGIDCDFDEDGAKDDAKDDLDGEDVHTKELTDEVKTRLREEAKENAGRDSSTMDETEWYTELTESYVDQGLDQDEFDEKVQEKVDEKKQEKVTEIVEEATGYTYEGE